MKRYIKSSVGNLFSEDYEEQAALAESPTSPAYVLEELADSSNTRIRLRVAGNSNTPESALKQLAVDSSNSIRAAVASNPSVSPEVLSQLITDIEEVRSTVIASPNVTDEILFQMAKNCVNSGTGMQNDDMFEIAKSKKASANTLTYIYEHTDSDDNMQLRRLARNPNTPTPILEILKEYPNSEVSGPASHALESR